MTSRALTPVESCRLGQQARRWAIICRAAGEIDEARHQLMEAARYFDAADQIEFERKAA